MSLKIKTSFLFKNRNSSQKPKNDHLSNNRSATKNTSIINEDVSPSTSRESFKQDEHRGAKRKQSFNEDIDSASSGGDSSFENVFDEEDSPSNSPKFAKQINISPHTENEWLKQRQENIKARDAFLLSFMKDPDFAEAVQNVGLFKKNEQSADNSSSKYKPQKRRTSTDTNFRSFCRIPLEGRKSLRLQSKSPQFSYKDLPDDSTFAPPRKINYNSDDNLDNLEDIVYEPEIKRKSTKRISENIVFLSVEDVTDKMLKNISRRVIDKEYCKQTGTSCHQCRQKTRDTKTFCRSKDCGGVRGQFCGVCLLNRYGEDAAVALKDPNWQCPPCRGICNCSFCRTREGKRPTGILVPQAIKAGHKSVKDFLDSLRGKGDYVDPFQDPNKLLGFTEDLQYAQMGGGHKEFIGTFVNFTKFKETIEVFRKKLFENVVVNKSGDCTDTTQDPEVLLGFTKDNQSVMGDNSKSYIGSHTSLDDEEGFQDISNGCSV